MSAFVLDPAHIDLILGTAIHGPSDRRPSDSWAAPWAEELTGFESRLTPELADRAGASMLAENIASVRRLYPDSDLGALFGRPTPDPSQYEWTDFGPLLTIIEALKAIECFEYQSGEAPRWTRSGSALFCNRLRAALVTYLPGFEAARREWDVEAALARAPRRFDPDELR